MDATPLVVFSPVEVEQLNKQRRNTFIMKFSPGRHKLYEIRAHVAAEWHLAAPPVVGLMDRRHVTLHMESAADTQKALSRALNKIKNCLFRLFGWTPNFEIGKDSSMAAVWVKFFNLLFQ